MRAPLLWRRVHYWIALPLMVTALVIAVSGVLLTVRKDFAALQPPTQSGSAPGDLSRPIADLVAAVRQLPGHGATSWQDIDRIDVRPDKGIAKVILRSRIEVQVDLATGRPIQTGYRTSDWLETVHDFTILGDWGRYSLSLGSGVALTVMALSGAYLFLLPMAVKRRKRRARRRDQGVIRARTPL